MSIKSNNFFEIFSLQENFDLDIDELTAAYKKLQAQTHPDKFSDADDATRLQALQLSSIINDAFDTLKSPLKRAAYLLSLNGVNPEEHNQKHLGEDLLLQQMDWRDQLDSAQQEEDLNTIDSLKLEVKKEYEDCVQAFREQFSAANFNEAKPVYHKLQFIEKMLIELNKAEEKILDY